MSISLNANFELLSAGLYLDARQQFNTIIEMKDFAETSIPDGFITYNKETQKHYVFSSSNTVDATLGKWREYNSGGGSSEKQIKDWVSGSSYLEGDYIYHEGELYRCLASNSDVDFDETNWEQITYGIDELSKEDVERLLGLTKEEIEAMTDLILDTEVRLNKTYSSSKIYTDIQQCLEDSKTYTLEELGKKIWHSYEVVTSTDDMVSQERLYLLNNDNNYDIYIVDVNNVPVVIGDTSIDLSGYVTKTEIESELGTERLGTTSQTVKGAINELFQSVTNNEEDITDLENRITTNETNITGLQEQIDNLDIPEDVDLTEINNKLTRLETKQINKTTIVDMQPTPICYKITPKDNNTFSKILIVDLYGGCLLITGSMVPNYKSLKAVRLSNGCWESYSASNNVANKIESVYYDGSYIYVNCLNYIKINFEGGFTNVEKIDSLPSNVTQLPILDLTQGSVTDLTEVNTKIAQLENKTSTIPVMADNPTDYDLNNYKENGNYSIGDSTKYSNTPTAYPGLLTVIRSNSYRLQIYTVVTNNNVYYRYSTDWGATWRAWALLNDSSGASSNTNIYTTGEQVVGTWINGQTLYRQTIESNQFYSSGNNMIRLFEYNTNMNLVKFEGVVKLSNSTNSTSFVRALPFVDNSYSTNEQVFVTKTTLDTLRLDTKLTNYQMNGYIVSVYYYKN